MSPSIITISRQFGSGVRQIGAESVDRLNIPFSASPRISLNGQRTGRIASLHSVSNKRRELGYAIG